MTSRSRLPEISFYPYNAVIPQAATDDGTPSSHERSALIIYHYETHIYDIKSALMPAGEELLQYIVRQQYISPVNPVRIISATSVSLS